MQRTAYEMRISDWSSDVCSSDLFTAAFSGSSRTARLAPATRLLAMKRPDVFVCVNGGNTPGLAEALSFAPTTITLENYWARVIESIRQAPWYWVDRPTGRDTALWDASDAMLAAHSYRPRNDRSEKCRGGQGGVGPWR